MADAIQQLAEQVYPEGSQYRIASFATPQELMSFLTPRHSEQTLALLKLAEGNRAAINEEVHRIRHERGLCSCRERRSR